MRLCITQMSSAIVLRGSIAIRPFSGARGSKTALPVNLSAAKEGCYMYLEQMRLAVRNLDRCVCGSEMCLKPQVAYQCPVGRIAAVVNSYVFLLGP